MEDVELSQIKCLFISWSVTHISVVFISSVMYSWGANNDVLCIFMNIPNNSLFESAGL